MLNQAESLRSYNDFDNVRKRRLLATYGILNILIKREIPTGQTEISSIVLTGEGPLRKSLEYLRQAEVLVTEDNGYQKTSSTRLSGRTYLLTSIGRNFATRFIEHVASLITY